MRLLVVEKGMVIVMMCMLPLMETVMPIEEQQKYPFTIITFTDKEYKEWILHLPEDIIHAYWDQDMNAIHSYKAIARGFFNPKPIIHVDATPSNTMATTLKRKWDSNNSNNNGHTTTNSSSSSGSSSSSSSGQPTSTKTQKRANMHLTNHKREAIKWDKHDMPPDWSGHPPPVSWTAISSKVVEHKFQVWGNKQWDYLNSALPLAIKDLPVAHHASLTSHICISIPTLRLVPYV